MKATKYIWKNGDFLPWEEATTHVLSHVLHYGTGYFEGIRAYKTPKGPAIFRGLDHYKRLMGSIKIYNHKTTYQAKELLDQTKTLIQKNQVNTCYIRPLFYFGYGAMGILPRKNPLELIIACWEWGAYLGEEGLKNGIRAKVSSWKKIDTNALPLLSKCSANYANSMLAKQEVENDGYDEAILMNQHGTVAEGPGENIFMIKNGTVYSPPTTDAALQGITANSVVQILENEKIPFATKSLTRDELYTADEVFFTGTAAEITPIREIDNIPIGSGKRGPLTQTIQAQYFDIVQGKNKKYDSWLDYVN